MYSAILSKILSVHCGVEFFQISKICKISVRFVIDIPSNYRAKMGRDLFSETGMTQNMDMTVMDKIFISKHIMNFKKL